MVIRKVLEIGCGDGTLWKENKDKLPENIEITLSDISEGMLRDARRNAGIGDHRFRFRHFDCHRIRMRIRALIWVLPDMYCFTVRIYHRCAGK